MNETEINPIEEIIEKEDEIRIFNELSKIDGLHEYLRTLMARDMRLHFTCPKTEQDLIRGSFYRTEWLSKKIKSVSTTNIDKV